jgi:hypothetical protein
MDQQDIKELLEAMLTKKDKNASKYPGPGGSVVRWKRTVIRELGSEKQHKHLLVDRLIKDPRKAKQFITVKETLSEDKDKDKGKKKKYIYSKDIDTGVATPKKKIFGDNTATEAKKLLSKVKKTPDKYNSISNIR